MKEELLISIIMPAYNAEQTIKESVLSVMAQTYNNWELIIIDDCSTDDTLKIVKELSSINSNIIVLQNLSNKGVSVTRNKGISKARGTWIAFLDSDDKWETNKLEKQVSIINKKDNADLIFTGSSFIDECGKKAGYFLEVPEEISYRELLKQNLISCSSVLLKKTLASKYEMKHDDMHEDYAVWLQILKNGYHAYGINEALLIYRLSQASKSGNKKKAAFMTYKVYRFMGLNHLQSLYYFSWYVVRNIKKYNSINKSI